MRPVAHLSKHCWSQQVSAAAQSLLVHSQVCFSESRGPQREQEGDLAVWAFLPEEPFWPQLVATEGCPVTCEGHCQTQWLSLLFGWGRVQKSVDELGRPPRGVP